MNKMINFDREGISSASEQTYIAYDLKRFIKNIHMPYPSGIQRVDINYLHTLLHNQDYHVCGVLDLMINNKTIMVKVCDTLTRKIYHHLYDRWILQNISDEVFASHSATLLDELTKYLKTKSFSLNSKIDDELILQTKKYNKPIYFNSCFFDIEGGEEHFDLIKLANFHGIYLVHDVIAIEFPEFTIDGIAQRQLKSLIGIAANNSTIIAISEVVKSKIESIYSSLSIKKPNIYVNKNGVDDKFLFRSNTISTKRNQFIFVSTLEPRKNHILLLNVWKKFINENNIFLNGIPKLIFIGRRGWSNQILFDMLDKNSALREHVIEKNNASDEEMISEIQASKACLFPSFDEGWGLPIVESLALGTPVICSNIEVFHETAQENAIFIDPIDALGWQKAIAATSNDALKFDAINFQPITWADNAKSFYEIINKLTPKKQKYLT
jgi:glycosyltransferase involved in cell wall biosynthesis